MGKYSFLYNFTLTILQVYCNDYFYDINYKLKRALIRLFTEYRLPDNSRLQVFFKMGILKIFARSTKKHLCWCLFLNKVAGLRL